MKNPLVESIVNRLYTNFSNDNERYLQTQRLVKNINKATLENAEEEIAFQKYLYCKKWENVYAVAFAIVVSGIVSFFLAIFESSDAIAKVFILIAFVSFIYAKLDYASFVDQRFPKK